MLTNSTRSFSTHAQSQAQNIARQTVKYLTYNPMTRDYYLKEYNSAQEYLKEKNSVYLIRGYPPAANGSERPDKADDLNFLTTDQEFGSDQFNKFQNLKKSLNVEELSGFHIVNNISAISIQTDTVKQSRDFMKTCETRESLNVLFLNQTQFESLIGRHS